VRSLDPFEENGRPESAEEESIGLGQLIRVEEATPSSLFVLPLRQAVPFPGILMPVQLSSDRARAIVAKAADQGGFLGLFARRSGTGGGGEQELGGMADERLDEDEDDIEAPAPKELHRIGVVAKVLKQINLPDGRKAVMLQGLKRVRMIRAVRRRPFLILRVEDVPDIPPAGDRAEAQVRNLQTLVRGIVENSPQVGEEFLTAAMNFDYPGQMADFCAAYLIRNLGQRQAILEALDVGERLDLVVEALTRELTLLELGARIRDEIKQKVEKAQKEFFLREQIKIIRRELGEEVDSKEAEIRQLKERIEAAGLPDPVREKAEEELERMRVTPVESPEHTVLGNHLDWILALPWSVCSEDRRDLRGAKRVLEDDHFGLREVKERILEFLAVHKLKKGYGGSILCLSGPPGVGKTSLGRSIARAMGRKFWRFSLGGMRDEAEIKGHRRTYVGAMPGRILQGLRQCGTNNPVIMLDEVDKLGADFRGDPSSALLEVLDPEQNHAFLDHYLDLPFDLSKVFFIATANVLSMIPAPLRDRMEIIEIPGYLISEKVEIAARHLLAKQRAAHGLSAKDLHLGRPVLKAIVREYTREAGVRRLEQNISKICRKRALRVARGGRGKTRAIQVKDLPRYLGQPRFAGRTRRVIKRPGICQGLAWTPVGGELLYIEVGSWPGKGRILVTGSLGEVMKESVRIATDYLKGHADLFGLDLKRIQDEDLHVHFPAGAVPKDGPSAGITVASALLSLWLGRRCPKDLAMTGELTLVGEVLPIGGVREKVLAARHEGLRRILLPAANRADIREIDPELVAGMSFLFVEHFEEVARHLGFLA